MMDANAQRAEPWDAKSVMYQALVQSALGSADYARELGMNPDQLAPGERCASTSNRNFEGRQGPGGRTHLMSPAMAAAAAVSGRIADVREVAR